MAMTATQIRDVAGQAGFRGNALKIAVAVALCESSGNPKAAGDGGNSIGLWQIHMPSHPQFANERLLKQPLNNAKAAFQISKGGSNWQPWTTYRNGCYKKHLDNPGITAPGDESNSPGGLGGTAYTDPTAGLPGGVFNFGKFFDYISDGALWIRVSLVLLGVILLVSGLMVIANDLGLTDKLTKVASTVTKVKSPL